ncbi:hypothetical protein EmuJ_000398000 [Echinococcus multilocularis]|uniref:Uncharacterized protein n=1 Tax=Echinococcus multilocularis TaxID=6211 RepID=A0A068Y3R6_ECHMU|nr:hypothetical protein EmuJ_000398000 [Echinococcus multilocularis]
MGGFYNPCSYVRACLIHDTISSASEECIQWEHHGIGLNSKIHSKNMLSAKLLNKGTIGPIVLAPNAWVGFSLHSTDMTAPEWNLRYILHNA